VLCDYGPKIGRADRETDPDAAARETVLSVLTPPNIQGRCRLEVDLEACRARDVSAEIAEEVRERARLDDLPADVVMFVSLRAGVGV
jgi:hypothetical protein